MGHVLVCFLIRREGRFQKSTALVATVLGQTYAKARQLLLIHVVTSSVAHELLLLLLLLLGASAIRHDRWSEFRQLQILILQGRIGRVLLRLPLDELLLFLYRTACCRGFVEQISTLSCTIR